MLTDKALSDDAMFECFVGSRAALRFLVTFYEKRKDSNQSRVAAPQ